MSSTPQACAVHGLPLIHFGVCGQGCAIDFTTGLPDSPMGEMDQQATLHNELVMSYQRRGFTRSEAMQVLCCIISAGIMKGSGSGDG